MKRMKPGEVSEDVRKRNGTCASLFPKVIKKKRVSNRQPYEGAMKKSQALSPCTKPECIGYRFRKDNEKCESHKNGRNCPQPEKRQHQQKLATLDEGLSLPLCGVYW